MCASALCTLAVKIDLVSSPCRRALQVGRNDVARGRQPCISTCSKYKSDIDLISEPIYISLSNKIYVFYRSSEIDNISQFSVKRTITDSYIKIKGKVVFSWPTHDALMSFLRGHAQFWEKFTFYFCTGYVTLLVSVLGELAKYKKSGSRRILGNGAI